jgi:hypothetical protein
VELHLPGSIPHPWRFHRHRANAGLDGPFRQMTITHHSLPALLIFQFLILPDDRGGFSFDRFCNKSRAPWRNTSVSGSATGNATPGFR